MGATLRYAKVVDRDAFQRDGGKVRPGLDSEVLLSDPAPTQAQPFYVLRAWDYADAFTETWRITDPHGRTVHEGLPREVLAEHGELADEIQEASFEYDDDGYQLILEIDGREVARVDFPVRIGHALGEDATA